MLCNHTTKAAIFMTKIRRKINHFRTICIVLCCELAFRVSFRYLLMKAHILRLLPFFFPDEEIKFATHQLSHCSGIVADPDPVADPNDCPKSGLGSINKTVNPNPG